MTNKNLSLQKVTFPQSNLPTHDDPISRCVDVLPIIDVILILKKSVKSVARMLIALRFKGFFRLFDPTNPWMDVVRTTQEQLSTNPWRM